MIDSYPDVTVVVRAYNEEPNIIRCLESLLLQDYTFQTVVVNNGSIDNTQSYAEEFLERNRSFSATVINEPQRGRGIALQRGIDHADTDIIACLDADSYAVHPDWLEKLVSPLIQNEDVVASSGRIKFYNGPYHHKLLYDVVRSLVYFTSASLGEGWISLANSALRRSAYYEVGGSANLNGNYPEDRILALELRSQGKIEYVHEAEVSTGDWLLDEDKRTWGTHLIDELDSIRDIMGIPESCFHQCIRFISSLCARWDALVE